MPSASQKIHTLYYFKSPSCSPCQQISKTMNEYVKNSMAIRTVTIDIEKDNAFEMCAHFGVRSVPTVIATDELDNIISRHDGVKPDTVRKLLGME